MGKNILSGIRPTRMELLKLKKRKVLAQKGHDLLEEKRDALIMEFFKRIKDYRKDKAELELEIKKAFESLIIAQMIIGYTGLEESSYSVNEMKDVKMKVRNITGVKVPLIEKLDSLREGKERGYSFVSTSAKLDDAASSFENVVKNILKLAESEGSIRKLAQEIEKTKRRVNALENILIPKIGNTQKHIKMHLAELEREDFFRRKKIKSALSEESRQSAVGSRQSKILKKSLKSSKTTKIYTHVSNNNRFHI